MSNEKNWLDAISFVKPEDEILDFILEYFCQNPKELTKNIANALKTLKPTLNFIFYSFESFAIHGSVIYANEDGTSQVEMTFLAADYEAKGYNWKDKKLVGLSPPRVFFKGRYKGQDSGFPSKKNLIHKFPFGK